MDCFALTDIGRKRNLNQDSVFITKEAIGNLPNLFIVADGMGGESAGDYASRVTVETVTEYVKSCKSKQPVRILEQAISRANDVVYSEGMADIEKRGMGTTLVIATILDEHLYVANVGDSRLYVATINGLTQITRDHSVVADLIHFGKITEEEARNHRDKNKITRAIGAEERVIPDFFDVNIESGQIILMCSDGLTNMVENSDIYTILREDISSEEKAVKLVSAANENGGKDNITAIVVDPELVAEED